MPSASEQGDRVLLMGASLGTGNRGVSALGASLIKLARQAATGVGVSMLLGRRSNAPFRLRSEGGDIEVGVHNYRMSPTAPVRQQLPLWFALSCLYAAIPCEWWRAWLRRWHPLIRASADCRLVGDIRGGDSFSDIYGLRNFIQGCIPVFCVLLVRGRIVLLPQTYGPYKSPWARALARWILRRSSRILSRDRESLDAIRALIGDCPRTRFCPDVAFSLEARVPERFEVEPALPEPRPACLVGVNVNGLMFNGGYTRDNMFGLKMEYRSFVKELVERLLQDPRVHVLLVPHTFAAPGRVESDPEACQITKASLPSELAARAHLVTGEYDQSEIKGVIGCCDFFVGSRMHACIAALSQGIPAVGVAYSKKFVGVFESVGAADWVVDGRTTTNDQAIAKTMALFERWVVIRAELLRRVEEARLVQREVFRELLSSVETSGRSVPAQA